MKSYFFPVFHYRICCKAKIGKSGVENLYLDTFHYSFKNIFFATERQLSLFYWWEQTLFQKVEQQVNGIRPCDFMKFAAGLTSLQGGDGNGVEPVCLHGELFHLLHRQEIHLS